MEYVVYQKCRVFHLFKKKYILYYKMNYPVLIFMVICFLALSQLKFFSYVSKYLSVKDKTLELGIQFVAYYVVVELLKMNVNKFYPLIEGNSCSSDREHTHGGQR